MESVIRQKLDKDIFNNEVNYFFTSLVNRFDYANDLLVDILEKKYNKAFKPIYIYIRVIQTQNILKIIFLWLIRN